MSPTLPDFITDLGWPEPDRAPAFLSWLNGLTADQGLKAETVRLASADASFRRYFRIDSIAGTRVIMDAPPDKENCRPFVQVAELMAQAGLNAPRILAWDEAQGFMLLSDLGQRTLMQCMDEQAAGANLPWFKLALDVLLPWQQASKAGVLPVYDEAVLRRELSLFPDWYVAQHKGQTLNEKQQTVLQQSFDLIVRRNLAAPQVYVHRDFMPRNLMVSDDGQGPLGVLDFQDALYGPVTYDIASLMRDAFISWDEELVLDVSVRYWEIARKTGLLDFEDWSQDFGAFYRAVEWMSLQRHLKVAGIFARLTLRDGKPKYLADAPRFIHYIRSTASRYRELAALLRLLDEIEGATPAMGIAFGRVG
ncbi:MAG: phosphotransferase [Alphaproteobacteria bacterium]|nr:phosphotransferase [Alphaproteobacteria bacterium]